MSQRQYFLVAFDIESGDESSLAIHAFGSEIVGSVSPPLTNFLLSMHMSAVGTGGVRRDYCLPNQLPKDNLLAKLLMLSHCHYHIYFPPFLVLHSFSKVRNSD